MEKKLEQWIWILNTDKEKVVSLLKSKGFGEIKVISMYDSCTQGLNEEERNEFDKDEEEKADLETQSRVGATITVESKEEYVLLYHWWLDTIYDNFVMYTDEGEFEWY